MIATSPLLTTEKEVADYVYNRLLNNQEVLGLGSVEYDVNLIREYPSAVVTPGRKSKALHSTHTFRLEIECGITVYHAKLSVSRRQRTQEDLDLCAAIEALLEEDCNWPNDAGEPQVQFGFVTDILPGTITRPKGDQVVGTRMVITTMSQRRFK